MHSRQILIVYGSKYGQTAKIARRIAEIVRARGESATVLDANHMPPALVLTAYDGVIVGGSVIGNPLLRWVMKQISKRHFGPTDTSRDYELTDWAEVQRFTDRYLTLVRRYEEALVSFSTA